MGIGESDGYLTKGYREIGPAGLERNLGTRAVLTSRGRAPLYNRPVGDLCINNRGEFYIEFTKKKRALIEHGDSIRLKTEAYHFGTRYVFVDQSD